MSDSIQDQCPSGMTALKSAVLGNRQIAAFSSFPLSLDANCSPLSKPLIPLHNPKSRSSHTSTPPKWPLMLSMVTDEMLLTWRRPRDEVGSCGGSEGGEEDGQRVLEDETLPQCARKSRISCAERYN